MRGSRFRLPPSFLPSFLLAAGNQDQAENGQNEWMGVEVGGGAAAAAKSVGEATLYFSGRTTGGTDGGGGFGGGLGSGFGAGDCAHSRNLAPISAPHPKVAPRGYDRRPSRTASGRIVARRRSGGKGSGVDGMVGGRERGSQGGRGTEEEEEEGEGCLTRLDRNELLNSQGLCPPARASAAGGWQSLGRTERENGKTGSGEGGGREGGG